MDDDMISEDIDLGDGNDGFAGVERIELPVRHARHDILIEELARVERVQPLSRLPSRLASIVSLAAWRCYLLCA